MSATNWRKVSLITIHKRIPYVVSVHIPHQGGRKVQKLSGDNISNIGKFVKWVRQIGGKFPWLQYTGAYLMLFMYFIRDSERSKNLVGSMSQNHKIKENEVVKNHQYKSFGNFDLKLKLVTNNASFNSKWIQDWSILSSIMPKYDNWLSFFISVFLPILTCFYPLRT